MSKQWKAIRFVALMLALPLVATAAASAHSWMVDNSPISLEVPTPISLDVNTIGMERVHVVSLDSSGAIKGRIANIDGGSENTQGIAKLKVFFIQNGEIVKESYTNSDGSFEVMGLPEGDYSFVASGQSGFAAYGVRVVTDHTGKYPNVMEVAAVASGVSTVKSIVDVDAIDADQDVEKELTKSNVEEFVGANRVQLVNGQLNGRVMAMTEGGPIGETVVHIIQNKERVAEVQVDESGAFVVPALEAGVYDFVAIGRGGVAVLAFEAVETANIDAVGLDDSVELEVNELVSTSPVLNYAAALNVLLIEPQDVAPAPVQDSVLGDSEGGLPIEFAGQDGAMGAATGGTAGSTGVPTTFTSTPVSGGGGGGVIGAGRGRLLGLGLIGGVIALAVTSGNPDSASPVQP